MPVDRDEGILRHVWLDFPNTCYKGPLRERSRHANPSLTPSQGASSFRISLTQPAARPDRRLHHCNTAFSRYEGRSTRVDSSVHRGARTVAESLEDSLGAIGRCRPY